MWKNYTVLKTNLLKRKWTWLGHTPTRSDDNTAVDTTKPKRKMATLRHLRKGYAERKRERMTLVTASAS